jgi:hypothetical protein
MNGESLRVGANSPTSYRFSKRSARFTDPKNSTPDYGGENRVIPEVLNPVPVNSDEISFMCATSNDFSPIIEIRTEARTGCRYIDTCSTELLRDTVRPRGIIGRGASPLGMAAVGDPAST